ncbi:hypothetical protein VTN96DRAFT_6052 [Rasamsonia emersonii]|uniref:Sterol 24-C-methyltransferase n=1 Tax=Rasamsonia emersonii (strain ATCC 16479 / CBS 393.64 / IMI 116815) TaxID=1408163 RepID=A0A0F4YKY2_RASE3|nr:Sterol 24-C-methyltransferase [Rasamsonia emersonii CBS 393.64]KKA18531.1 Sterol 24-C-methyltransferase [Rasamsonia emersonii CBS 393.64]
MAESDQEPLINDNPSLQSYYCSLESRIGYRLFLGGTRHFGYYETDTWWPFPIGKALRAMEDHLSQSLALEAGAEVLDAGCGVGHVAIHLARKGLRIQAIDVVDHHLVKARRNVKAAGLDNAVTVRKGDYHHLEHFPSECVDGVYTMETFVHATDPAAALGEFFRVLKPGGSIALYEYDHRQREAALQAASEKLVTTLESINKYAAMPANTLFDQGVLPAMMEEAGFTDVKVTDLSVHVRPMLRLFFICAYLPYIFIKFFGLERWFINTVAGVEAYRGSHIWRYVAVTAKKPSTTDRPREAKKVQ